MTNAESPGVSGQEKSVSPREKWRGKLKFHSFLVYFHLWAVAIYQLVQGVSLLERQEPSEIFRLYPKLTVLNSVTGALMIVWCLGLAVSTVRLARFKKGAPETLTMLLGSYPLLPLGYTAAVSIVTGARFFALLDESFPIELLINVVTIGIVAAYYDARKELFEASHETSSA